MKIERTFSKEKILELYLNEIYLGMGAYGVAAASLLYFDKSVHELTTAEAAYLAALPKAPNNYHPFRQRERALEHPLDTRLAGADPRGEIGGPRRIAYRRVHHCGSGAAAAASASSPDSSNGSIAAAA